MSYYNEDPAECVINHLISGLLASFDATSEIPPLGGGALIARFFAGDQIPLAAFVAHRDELEGNDTNCTEGCCQPFLWVRLLRRYRTTDFPNPIVTPGCNVTRALAVEIGAARCSVPEATPTMDAWGDEAEVNRDDGWRLDIALCMGLTAAINDQDCAAEVFAIEQVIPYGPDGGVIGVVGTAFVQI